MSHHKIIEDIPENFTRRIGDWYQEGCNNTLIVLGTDRAAPGGPASINEGLGRSDHKEYGLGTGTITIITGRKDLKNGNINLTDDDAFLYLSMKTEVDKNLGLEKIPVDTDPVDFTGPSAILKSSVVRLVYRDSIKISNKDGSNYVFIDNELANISLNNKVKVLLDSRSEGKATVWIGENVVDIDGSGKITVTAEDTTTRLKSGGEIKVGQLSTALEELINILTGTGSIISKTGNLGAPVPMNPNLIIELGEWKTKWIAGDNFIKMDG